MVGVRVIVDVGVGVLVAVGVGVRVDVGVVVTVEVDVAVAVGVSVTVEVEVGVGVRVGVLVGTGGGGQHQLTYAVEPSKVQPRSLPPLQLTVNTPKFAPVWKVVGCPRFAGGGENPFEVPTGILTGKSLMLIYPNSAQHVPPDP